MESSVARLEVFYGGIGVDYAKDKILPEMPRLRNALGKARRFLRPFLIMSWTQQQAIELCKRIEPVCPKYGCHVALTGGLLYKDGPRKDCDILFYRIRQWGDIDDDGLFQELDSLGILKKIAGFGWCIKAVCEHGNVDCFFPEETNGEYPVS